MERTGEAEFGQAVPDKKLLVESTVLLTRVTTIRGPGLDQHWYLRRHIYSDLHAPGYCFILPSTTISLQLRSSALINSLLLLPPKWFPCSPSSLSPLRLLQPLRAQFWVHSSRLMTLSTADKPRRCYRWCWRRLCHLHCSWSQPNTSVHQLYLVWRNWLPTGNRRVVHLS